MSAVPTFSEAPALAADLLTWRQFNERVDELCPLEATRVFGKMFIDPNAAYFGSSVYYRRIIRQAVLDLRFFIKEYTRNNETVYFNSDFAEDGMAHVGALPPNSHMTDAWYYDAHKQRRCPVKQIPWQDRFEMASNRLWDNLEMESFNGDLVNATSASLDAARTIQLLHRENRPRVGLMAISPGHERFYLYPKVQHNFVFSIFWDGQKLCDRDQELVPFDEEAVKAVSDYVKADFAGYFERDNTRKADFMKDYAIKRGDIFIRLQAKGFPDK